MHHPWLKKNPLARLRLQLAWRRLGTAQAERRAKAALLQAEAFVSACCEAMKPLAAPRPPRS